MSGSIQAPEPRAVPWTGRAGGWLRGSRGGLLAIALVVGAGSGLGAVAFRYLIYFFTWLATGHVQFGQQGRVPSGHLPWLGLAFFIVIPVIGGLIYGPLIYKYAREARGHGVPEVMIAVAEEGGRIRPQVAAVKSIASAICIGVGGSVGREGPIVQIGSALASSLGQWVKMPENRLRILVACGAAGGIAATFEDLTAADAMRAFQPALPADPGPGGPAAGYPALPGPVTGQLPPQVLFATESLTQAVRQLELYGRDGLPVISDDGQHLQGWLTSHNVLQAVARHIRTARDGGPQAQPAAGQVLPGPQEQVPEAPAPLGSYQLLEVTIPPGSPAAGQPLGGIAWPPGCVPVTVLDHGTLRDADPGISLAAGDRITLLAPAARTPAPSPPRGGQPAPRPADAPAAGQELRPEDGGQHPPPDD